MMGETNPYYDGDEVFELLAGMTKDERARCVFPLFFTDSDYEDLCSVVAENADLSPSEYAEASRTKNGDMAGWMKEASMELHHERDDFELKLCDYVKDEIISRARERVKMKYKRKGA